MLEVRFSMRTAKGYRLVDIDLGLGGAVHTILLRQHVSKVENGEQLFHPDKTLFVGNVDYGRHMTNEEVDGFLRDLLISFGDIEAITLSHFTKSDDKDFQWRSRFAHVCFKKKKSIQAVLAASNGMFSEISSSISQKWGVSSLIKPKKYSAILDANRINDTDVNELKRKVDLVLEEYEMTEVAAAEERARMLNHVDEDGFQMVKTRKKKKRSESAMAKRGSSAPRERKPKKKDTQLANFYGHQIREQKRNQLIELRKRFEEDKKKVADLKAGRKFKPF